MEACQNVLHVQNTGEVGNGARPVSVGSAPNTRQSRNSQGYYIRNAFRCIFSRHSLWTLVRPQNQVGEAYSRVGQTLLQIHCSQVINRNVTSFKLT